MASGWYNKGVNEIGNQGVDFLNDTIKTLLITDGYTYNPDHNFVSDVVANEVPSAARQTLASKTITEDDTNNRSVYDAADPVFPSVPAGVNVHGAITFKDTGADATSPLLVFNDVTNTPTNGGNITIQFPATGLGYGQI